jgi:orotate phosphoribosyltransferase
LMLLDKKAVVLRKDPPFVWVSGIKAPIYTDNRILISHPDVRTQVVNELVNIIKDIECDVIAGTAIAGIPWAALVADKLQLPMVYVRSGKKEHGKENKIEGDLQDNSTAVVVEDLISTGASSIETADALKSKGCVVKKCIAIFSYQLPDSKRNFENANIELKTLTNFTELIAVAVEQKYVSEEDKDQVLEWKDDPWGWPTPTP